MILAKFVLSFEQRAKTGNVNSARYHYALSDTSKCSIMFIRLEMLNVV